VHVALGPAQLVVPGQFLDRLCRAPSSRGGNRTYAEAHGHHASGQQLGLPERMAGFAQIALPSGVAWQIAIACS
jgi:hypothetical protein